MLSNASTANDGDARDIDATDPGDWLTLAEVRDGRPVLRMQLPPERSWHGTRTSSLIGALAGTASAWPASRNVGVLPVRVLGKCGGRDSDIIAGMRWAAGLSVPGCLPTQIRRAC